MLSWKMENGFGLESSNLSYPSKFNYIKYTSLVETLHILSLT